MSTNHPTPPGTKACPAELVTIEYLHTVYAPDYLAGKQGTLRTLERHWAEQLIAQGYAELVSTPTGADETAADGEVAQPGRPLGPAATDPSIETRQTHAAAEAIEARVQRSQADEADEAAPDANA